MTLLRSQQEQATGSTMQSFEETQIASPEFQVEEADGRKVPYQLQEDQLGSNVSHGDGDYEYQDGGIRVGWGEDTLGIEDEQDMQTLSDIQHTREIQMVLCLSLPRPSRRNLS